MRITELLTEARLAGKFLLTCIFVRSFNFDGPGTAQQEAIVANALNRLEQFANELGLTMQQNIELQHKSSMQSWFITSPHMSNFTSVASRGVELENFANDLLKEIKNSIPEFTGWLTVYINYRESTNGLYHALVDPSNTKKFLDGEETLFDLLNRLDTFNKIDKSEIIQ